RGHREAVVGAVGLDVPGHLAGVVGRGEVGLVLAGENQLVALHLAPHPPLDGRAVADVRDRLVAVDRYRDRPAAAADPAREVGRRRRPRGRGRGSRSGRGRRGRGLRGLGRLGRFGGGGRGGGRGRGCGRRRVV